MPSTPAVPDQAPSAGGAAPGPRSPDWERIELDYRAGIKTLRQIADQHGITEGAIRKRAKRDEWTRDLSGRIQDKAEQLVRKEAVRSEVRKERTASEREVVDANARAVADVKLAQRTHIQRASTVAMSLLAELEEQTTNPALFEEIEQVLAGQAKGEALTASARTKLQDGMSKAMSLSSRSSTMRSLAESLRILITLERQAYGMRDGDGGGDEGDKEFLERLLNARARAANR
ncbi:hypothetical protein N5K37_29965 [Delftia tsuruhatensis]|uniref:hypothetical protein n=1 Tax=Delftia tsuruhatensis TaxID=180282 RepID=UPI00244978FB|nr:hypothetical protein [Delftia tsuruhatensis]MDH2234148.1 hypothetical protein [Delftia tsuruhatensis]